MNLSVLVNHRLPGESAVAFRERRRHFNRVLKLYLQRGRPATHSRDKTFGKTFGLASMRRPCRYMPGPHPSHKPKEIVTPGFTLGPAGAPVGHLFKVIHPGTLIKIQVTR